MKLVITNTYGEDDRYLRHTFYNNQSQQNSAPGRKLSCHIVPLSSCRQRTTIS